MESTNHPGSKQLSLTNNNSFKSEIRVADSNGRIGRKSECAKRRGNKGGRCLEIEACDGFGSEQYSLGFGSSHSKKA